MPPAWPPEVLLDVREYFAQTLEGHPEYQGWWSWYALQKSPRILIGSGGFNGPPDEAGTVTVGYAVLPGFEGRGYASELAGGLVRRAFAVPTVKRIFATTFERHHASVRVLEKNGFIRNGVSSEDAAAAESDRQGRGRLMLYAKMSDQVAIVNQG